MKRWAYGPYQGPSLGVHALSKHDYSSESKVHTRHAPIISLSRHIYKLPFFYSIFFPNLNRRFCEVQNISPSPHKKRPALPSITVTPIQSDSISLKLRDGRNRVERQEGRCAAETPQSHRRLV